MKKPFKKPEIVAQGSNVTTKNSCGKAGCQGK